ncbi:keratin-associated protein 4-7 [Biomphalaria glabrata]|nr:keratin-associated protein 4-7 [Biomphalaria glabrata]
MLIHSLLVIVVLSLAVHYCECQSALVTTSYCVTNVTSFSKCPPTYCYVPYGSTLQSQCCLGIYKTATGSFYQQCHCQNSCTLPSQTTITTTTPRPSSFNCCTTIKLPKTCANPDVCFNSATRNSCCLDIERVALDGGGTSLAITCKCNTDINC